MEILVIADDFTGSTDTGVRFYQRGFSVDIVFDAAEIETKKTEVVVINTNTRNDLIENAHQTVYQVCQKLSLPSQHIYKKVDSTLRGNVGAELEACMQGTKRDLVIFCSALPAANRIIKNGICLVSGVPLLATEFATDPRKPVISSSVKDIIASQTSTRIVEIDHAYLEQMLLQQIAIATGTPTIFVVDAETEQDLKQISDVIEKIDRPVIIAGSSGLASYVFPKQYSPLPMLFVIGSMSSRVDSQIKHFLTQNIIEILELDTKFLLSDQDYQNSVIDTATSLLLQGKHLVIKTDNSLKARISIDNFCNEFQMDRVVLGDRIARSLAELIERILNKIANNIAGLFLTGGDIAMQVIRQLNLHHYRIAGEIETGVPYGYFSDPKFSHIPVITKAGAFGSDNVLQHSLEFIESLTKEH